MAEQPENHTLQLLREIRAKQDEHSATLADHSARLVHIERALRESKKQFTYMIGVAASAEYASDSAKSRAEEFAERWEELSARIDEIENRPNA